MECAHCGFSCGPEKSRYMTMEVFEAAMEIASEFGETITIGGGEPTNHPLFFDFLGKAIIANESEQHVFVITNGNNTEKALKLSRLQEQGVISCQLSVDDFHYGIDHKVYQAFGYYQKKHVKMNVRTVRLIVKQGRAKNLEIELFDHLKESDGCICSDLFIAPTGKVYSCGCFRQKLGHILDPNFSDILHEFGKTHYIGECYKENLKEEEDE
jgi:MoaA/NifB/PqqE/SkfB family radical SAM enzyme